MSVEKGVIRELEIMGDYFFTLPTEEFCRKMTGTAHTMDGVLKSIRDMGNICEYFSNITAEEIAGMFFE